ncbi:thiamine pyrophosphate-binding protein [Salibacterium aidingense]|uniref:thiamine pyrophosphate-binding protein n=1 Tax=Salibacterium aidingense TaxID=384933 RepID=UPI000404B70A|nr:thiamine pyrophosphate-binding protein [Salibacterium aidingense]
MKTVSEMKTMTGAQAMVGSMKEEKINNVFGLIGSATMEVFDSLYDQESINYIGVRDERTGTHMADAYSRALGGGGMMLAGQNGPGATNLVTGLAQAYHANSPVVAVAGSIATNHVYRDAFQEVDQQALFTPVTKKTWTVNRADRIPEMVQEAFRVSQAGKKGPVVLNVPRDVLSESTEFESFPPAENYRSESYPAASPAQLEQAVELLKEAKNPLILAGAGVKWSQSQQSVEDFAELINAPISTSAGHGDAVSSDHPLYAGQVGPRGNTVASNLAKTADVILVLGSRLGFNSTFYTYDNLNPSAKIIQVNIDHSALSRYFPVEVGIVGSAGTVVEQLTNEMRNQNFTTFERENWVIEFQNKRKELLSQRIEKGLPTGSVIQPNQVFHAVNATMPKDTMFTLDAGTLCLQATDVLNYRQSPSLFSPLDFGLVGFSYAAGLGLKAARPDRTVVSLMGDGGFGMTMSEIGTAVENNLNSLTIVMNNHCWGAEKAYQRDFFGERYLGADVPNPRFDQAAELFGAKGFYVDHPSQLEKVFSSALKSSQKGHPTVVDVQVDPNALYSFRRDSFKHRAK